MAADKSEQHQACMQRFIDLANEMTGEGIGVEVVSWSLMSASALYASYSVTGNEGGLTESGIDKVADAYRKNLARITEIKRREQEAQQQ